MREEKDTELDLRNLNPYRKEMNQNWYLLFTRKIRFMSKTMCRLSKKERLEKQEGELKYKCKSCGEKARKEKHLCEPKKL